MKLKGILFDFNGTLYFDSRMHIDAFNLVFRELGVSEHKDAYMIEKIFGRDNGTIFRQNVKADATAEETDAFSRRKEELYQQLCRACPATSGLVKGAEELLDYLKEKDIPYCMATGSDLYNVAFYFDYLKLGRWFTMDNIVYCDKTYPGKPAPDIYRIAADRIGLEPAECLVFEDGTSGILSANGAGAGAVVLIHEEGYPSPLNGQTRVDRSFHDFTEWRSVLSDFGLLR